MRRFSSRPSGVVFGPIGSESARPADVKRAGSPVAVAMMSFAPCARAAESWKFEGKRTVRMGWLSVWPTTITRPFSVLSASPMRFSSVTKRGCTSELPEANIEQETTMSGGESLWRAQWSERTDPFAHLGPAQSMRASTRGPGWQRAARGSFNPEPQRVFEARASAVSLGNQGRTDLALGQRVFHGKFGYGTIASIEGNKLEIDFEKAGRKKVLDSFVSAS